MVEKTLQPSRRAFLKAVGAAGLAAAWGAGKAQAQAPQEPERVPRRPFGKTGFEVSALSLGGMFDIPNNQLLLGQAHRLGVTYWDTADCYGGGRSEKGIGQYFRRNPEHRADVFLVTKSDDGDPDGMTRLLDRSLERMNVESVDLYLLHGIRSTRQLDDETRRWADRAKARGKIRLFGFSTHSNMESCLLEAARLGWVDGIMTTYNFRLMHTAKMKEAVEACAQAGIGLTAMKTQGGGQVTAENDTELELAGRFLRRGFTEAQARLKAVWEDPRIASICSQMPSMTILMANAAAAVDRTRLTGAERQLMERYAAETAFGYCAGCTGLCEPALGLALPIGDVMRCLMYHRNYGETTLAAELFRSLPPEVRHRLRTEDFSAAERRCPQRMAIGRLMRDADRLMG